MFSNQLGEKLQ